METLPVIFRAERSGDHKGEVTAVFPTLANDYAGREFVVYMHVGQHSGGSYAWYQQRTRPATPAEYAPLLRELRSIYEVAQSPGGTAVTLVVRSRMTAKHREAVQDAAREYREGLRANPLGAPFAP